MKCGQIVLFVLAACLPSLAAAHDPTGSIEGAITDRSSAVIRNARVVATNLDTGLTKETESGADGYYRLLLLPPRLIQFAAKLIF